MATENPIPAHRPAKVLHVARTLDPAYGGPVHWIEGVCHTLQAQGHSSETLTADDPQAAFVQNAPFPAHAVGAGRGNYGHHPGIATWIAQNHHRYHAVVLHAVWQHPALAAAQVLAKTQTPYFVMPHGMYDEYFHQKPSLTGLRKKVYWNLLFKSHAQKATGFIWTNQLEQNEAFPLYRLPEAKNHVIAFGPEAPPIVQNPRQILQETLPQIQGRPFLLFLGRVDPIKNLEALLQAHAQAPYPGPRPLLAIGGPAKPDYQAQLEALAAQCKITQDVAFLGLIKEPAKSAALAAAQAVCLVSHLESFGLSAVEALAQGTPVVVSDKVKMRPAVTVTGAGEITTTDPASIAPALARWATYPDQDRPALAQSTREYVLQKLSIQASAADLLKLIQSLPPKNLSHFQ